MQPARVTPSRAPVDRGFTLVELLIVISIIAILASLIAVGLTAAQQKSQETQATSMISTLRDAAQTYQFEKGSYPGFGKMPSPDRNDFPVLWRAIMHRPSPLIADPPSDNLVVQEGDTYRKATRAEIFDEKVDKYLLDPWGSPYVYRCNQGVKEPEAWMINPGGIDIYSLGPNMKDDTIAGYEGEKNDDIK